MISVFSKLFFHLYLPAALIFTVLLGSGCSVTRIYHQTPASKKALPGINSLYVEQFKGEQSVLFNKLLTHEINLLSRLKYLAVFPETEITSAALLSVEVKRYYIQDQEGSRNRINISLVEHEELEDNPDGLNTVRRTFEFVEKPFSERIINRILDLEITFSITNISADKTLYQSTEKASIKQSYHGEENILLIPDANDEMVRLAQLLIQKFLNQINPEPYERVFELEKGTSPLPWTAGLLDFGHPRIIRSNHFATGNRYDLALKGWNYVLFEPRTYPKSERFVFNEDVFRRLKKADLPQTTLQPLLELYDKSFDPAEIKLVLTGLIPAQDFTRYASIIKAHARTSQNINRLNLAAAHYNLGVVYELRNELELADYHYAQANAYNPDEKYSQAWTDLQHLKGNYNPLESPLDRSVESAGKLLPPQGALLQPNFKKQP
ncbi:MAG: hypothetical protein H8E38_04465 [SAR324 cluster bacterium]|nr:hypothetical protein [SAR324 cluster bacterium]MBL7035603.1 hypothetical protein [SAR324 cluster bacterium]